MEGFTSGAELRIQADLDPANGSCVSSTSSAVFRKIQFHPARKHFNGFSNGGADFKIETLNPFSSDTKRPSFSGMGGGKRSDGSDFLESGLDPELNFGITFRKIGAGLENLGNTCFLNSVLQCLTYTEPLAAYLQSGKHQNSCHIAGFCALCAIQKHVSRALQATGRILAPKDLVSNLRCISRNFRNSRQEDAHEYMINLLESMHKCCLPSGVPSESPGAYEKSLVHKIFGGRLRSQVKCTQCSHCSNKFDPFLDLSLDIVKTDSLHKALSHFTAAELLDEGAKVYQCERCKQKVRALKQLTVHKAPYVLTIHLKRFRAHESGKIDKKVQFAPTIDMKQFVSGSYEGDLKYTLYGVLVHYGWSIHSGHYASFVRTSSGMWYSLDDNRVVQVSERTVLDQKAYMLFYVRDRKNIVPRKPIGVIQKENLKANVTMNKASAIVSPNLKEISAMQTNGHMMTKCSVAKEDGAVKPTAVKAIAGPQSEASSILSPDQGTTKQAAPSLNGNASVPRPENMSTSSAKFNNDVEGKSCKHKAHVSVNILSADNPPQTSSIYKLASNETLQKVNLPSDSESPNVTQPGNNYDNISKEASNIASARNSGKSSDPAESPIDQSCGTSQVKTLSAGNLLKEEAFSNGQKIAPEFPKLVTPCGVSSESPKITTPDSRSQIKSKKLRKLHVKNMHLGLKFFKLSLGLRKKKKHKRSKRSILGGKNLNEEILLKPNVTDVEPSTSESTRKVSSVSIQSHGKASKSSDRKSRKCASDSPVDATVGEFRERTHQNGCVLASDQQSLESSRMWEGGHQVNKEFDSPKDSCRGPSEKEMTSILTQGLEETVVASWDDVVSPSHVTESKSQTLSIGYVPDEWDEEYDRGKRKKIRTQKPSFGGPNPFQLVASKKFQVQKKAKVDKTSSSNTSFRI